jgi:hypothetical protein
MRSPCFLTEQKRVIKHVGTCNVAPPRQATERAGSRRNAQDLSCGVDTALSDARQGVLGMGPVGEERDEVMG